MPVASGKSTLRCIAAPEVPPQEGLPELPALRAGSSGFGPEMLARVEKALTNSATIGVNALIEAAPELAMTVRSAQAPRELRLRVLEDLKRSGRAVGDRGAGGLLLPALCDAVAKDEDYEVRGKSAEMLAIMGPAGLAHGASVVLSKALLEDAVQQVQENCAYALGELGEVRPEMEQALWACRTRGLLRAVAMEAAIKLGLVSMQHTYVEVLLKERCAGQEELIVWGSEGAFGDRGLEKIWRVNDLFRRLSVKGWAEVADADFGQDYANSTKKFFRPKYLRAYGYQVEESGAWGRTDPGQGRPFLDFAVTGHEEGKEKTIYSIECSLTRSAPVGSAPPIAESGPKLTWRCGMRLCHLRAQLHDWIKEKLGPIYVDRFKATKFASHGAPKGTTARLNAWFTTLANIINDRTCPPEIACWVFHMLYAPGPSELRGVSPVFMGNSWRFK